jgi:hypothetical protein
MFLSVPSPIVDRHGEVSNRFSFDQNGTEAIPRKEAIVANFQSADKVGKFHHVEFSTHGVQLVLPPSAFLPVNAQTNALIARFHLP